LTEIPEHLLKRAAARRAAMGGEGGDAPADAPASADAPVPAAGGDAPAATPAKAGPAPLPTLEEPAAKEKPDSPVVAAAKRRKRVPYWAAPVLALLPLWGILYVSSVSEPPAGEADPLVIGKEAYSAQQCAGCHGVNGEGGTGAKLSEGEVLKTFADPLSMAYWIHYGADQGARPDGTYGDLDREGGPHTLETIAGSAMPAFPDMDPEEMAALIIYIREELSGGDPAEDPNFNVDTFTADPEALAAMVEAVAELPPNAPDDVATVEGAETE
jgi:mono/diheme cytochrome c family protein